MTQRLCIFSKRTTASRATILSLLVVTTLCLLCPAGAHAQVVYGQIDGTVLDSTGAAVPGATVTVTDVNKGTESVVKTNGTGSYIVHDLIPDVYALQIDAAGFATAKSDQLTLTADDTIRFDVKLKIGTSSQVVEVTQVAPLLVTDHTEVATLLDSKTLVDMPNIDRNVTSLVILAPGTSAGYFSNAPAEDPQRSVQVSANGQTPLAAGFVLDGADDKDSFIGEIVLNPPLDSLEEAKFIVQDYDAEFGAAIAGITVMQTKSGSNKFHGSLYEFRHSDAQQARDPFTQYPGSGQNGNPDVPHTMYNKFGASVGGPILRNKLFFFGDYQGTRSKAGTSLLATVPTAEVQKTCTGSGSGNCDLSQYLAYSPNYQAYIPLSGPPVSGVYTGAGNTIIPGNLLPNSYLNNPGSLAAIKLMNLVPTPNVPGDPVVNNYLASGSAVYNFNQYDVRIDTQIGDKMHLFGRWGYLGSNQSSPGIFGAAGGPGYGAGGWAGTETGDNQSLAIGADRAINTKLLTELRFGWMHYALVEAKYDGTTPLMSNLGWAGLNSLTDNAGGASAVYFNDNNGLGLTSWGSSNGGGLHCNCPLNETENEYEIVNNWTRDMGNHSIKFGVDLRMLRQLRIPSDTNRAGEFTFYSQQASSTTPAPGVSGGGLALASYLFGNPGQMARYYSTSTNAMDIQPRMFFYVNDTWRATPKLTFNLGGRWEVYFPEHVNGAQLGGFWNQDTDMVQVAGVGGVSLSGGVKNNFSYLEPRLGVSYQLTPKTVLRAGIARAEDPGYWGGIFGQLLTQTIPVLQSQTFSPASGDKTDAARNPSNNSIYNIANSPDAPSTYAVPANGMFLLPNGQAPRTRSNRIILPDVYGWNVTYEWQIDRTTALTVGYVGSKSTHTIPGDGWQGFNVNDSPMYGYQNHLTCNASPLYLKFGQLFPGVTNCGQWQADMTGYANAHYNSLQFVLDKRYSKGLQFQASYVLSRSMGVTGANQFVQDNHINWGHYGYNRDNYFKLFGGYDLPFGRGRQFGAGMNSIANAIVGGFTVDASLGWGSGLPYTANFSTGCWSNAALGDPTGECLPNKVGSFSTKASSLNTTNHIVQYFTPSGAFTSNGQTQGAWQMPAAYTWGNEQANSLFGPGIFTTDATLRKSFNLHEDAKLSLEIDVRNLFNHPNLQNPNGCIDCGVNSSGGQITDIVGGANSSLGGMRQIEFGSHVTF